MISSFALTQEIRGQLETARRDLNLSQADLSEMAGMSQGAISNCLQGKPVRVDSLQRLLSAFAAAVASAEEQGMSPERAADLKKSIEAARRSMDGSSESVGYLARPGGPMPEEATNRIRRTEDQQFLAGLADAPFTAAVTGPPECGKSTLLQILAAEARRAGFAVADFDATLVTLTDAGANDAELCTAFFRELAEEVGSTVGERPETNGRWTHFDLFRFLKGIRQHRPVPPLLIVVDHVIRIPRALEELIQVCRSLDAHRTRTQVSWAIEISDFRGSDALGDVSSLAPSPHATLTFFTEKQVRELANLYNFRDDEQVEELWDWFSGQPFLTHAALTRWRDSPLSVKSEAEKPWNLVVEEIESADSEFGRHLSRLRSRLRPHWKGGEIEENLLHDTDSRKLLLAFGVIDDKGEFIKFYRHHLTKP